MVLTSRLPLSSRRTLVCARTVVHSLLLHLHRLFQPRHRHLCLGPHPAPSPGGSTSGSSCPLTEWEQMILDQHTRGVLRLHHLRRTC